MKSGRILAVAFLLSVSGGCTFYESGVKNKSEMFQGLTGVETYTSTYFGCEDTIHNKKPLAKQGYKLFYDTNNELWLECKDREFKLVRKVHMGPSPLEREIWQKGFPGGDKNWNKGYTQLNLHDCSKDVLCGTAERALFKFLTSTTMDKDKTCGKEDMLCASTLEPRREIRLKLDGTNLKTEIADLDRQYKTYKQVMNGSLPLSQLKDGDLLPAEFALQLKDEIIENILAGTNSDSNKRLFAKTFNFPENRIEPAIDKIIGDLASACKAKTLGEYAQDMNSVCVAYQLSRGSNVNEAGQSGYLPIFLAINGIKVKKQETEESYRIMRMLMLNGADLAYRDNPQPAIFRSPMNAKEFLTATRTDGMFSLTATAAPRVLALFSDDKILAVNSQQVKYARRAEELGLSKQEYLIKLSGVDALRKAGTFESLADAFKLTGSKEDFVAAQKMATTRSQKNELEFMAILATKDKTRIFDISTTLNEVTAQTVADESRSDRMLLIFKLDSKSSNTHFKGKTRVAVSKKSPMSLSGAYKLTVKYTLTVPIEQTTTVDFILTNSSTRTDLVTRTETKTFVIKPTASSDASSLDFGEVTIASSSKALGGIGKVKRTLGGDPTITTEIIKVEMING